MARARFVTEVVQGDGRFAAALSRTAAAALLFGAALFGGPAAPAQPLDMPGVQLASGAGTALVMGPSGVPIPSPNYVEAMQQLYLAPNGFGDFTPRVVFTPEGLYPITGVKSLQLDPSLAQGTTILTDWVHQLCPNPPSCGGEHIVVSGFSQSAMISTELMRALAALPADQRPDPENLAFVLVGNENNPNGGLLERFAGLTLPSLGMTFNGSTPDDVYPTQMYTLEYDGFADFPTYPLNLLADINAFLGIAFVHINYANLTPDQVAAAVELTTAGDTLTNYYMIPTENLPLLDPLRFVPVIGDPLADLFQPALRVLVNLGYGNIEHGWDPGPANLPTPFGLFPTHLDPGDVFDALVNGVRQGIEDFGDDLRSLSLTELLDPAPLPTPALADLIADPMSGFTQFVNAVTGAAASLYGALLPTADLLTAALTSLPMYGLNLFTDGIQEALAGDLGGLIDAVGNPIAATVGIGTLAAGIELLVLGQGLAGAVGEFADLFG